MVQDLVGLDLDIRSLTLGTPERLMDHDARVGQAVALALIVKECELFFQRSENFKDISCELSSF